MLVTLFPFNLPPFFLILDFFFQEEEDVSSLDALSTPLFSFFSLCFVIFVLCPGVQWEASQGSVFASLDEPVPDVQPSRSPMQQNISPTRAIDSGSSTPDVPSPPAALKSDSAWREFASQQADALQKFRQMAIQNKKTTMALRLQVCCF